MLTSLTKPHDGNSLGRDAHQLLLLTFCNPALVRTDLAWYYQCLLAKPADNNHSFLFFTISSSWPFLSSVLCLCLCFQVTHVFWKCFCLGLKFLFFYNTLPHSYSSSDSLFHFLKPGPQSQARYDYILVVVILRGAMQMLFPESGVRGKQI